MRRCAIACLLLVGFSIGGCAWLENFFKEKPGGSDASKVQQVVGGIPVYGQIASAVLGIGGLLFGGGTHVHHRRKHKKLQAENLALKKQIPPAAPAA